MAGHPVLIGGAWQSASFTETFHAMNPATGEALPQEFPVSQWGDLEAALSHAVEAAESLRAVSPEQLARFLSAYAVWIETHAAELIEIAHLETALPKSPRLQTIELPRTTTQLRQAAAAAMEGSWSLPVIDVKNNIRSCHAAIGPVLIMGPNNFPFAFNAVSGGDFAAAIAAGNPVIAKGHPNHPGTTRLLAEGALAALQEGGLPAATVQMIYHMSNDCGLRAAADPRLGAMAFTGSRRAGMALKAAADAAGKPAFLEMSSLNPLVILPGALQERAAKIADEYADSALAANGQFCTNPGLVFLMDSAEADDFSAMVRQRFEARTPSALLSKQVQQGLAAGVAKLLEAGAQALTGGAAADGACAFRNTLLRVDGDAFLAEPAALQTEAFGNAVLFVMVRDADQLAEAIDSLEGQLTGCVYSAAAGGADEALYERIAPLLRRRVGRLLNDKMPTGVALSPAMNHGGPYPATGHPGFSAVGIPGSLRRFSQLECYDNVRPSRLPPILQNHNPGGRAWRMIDGKWTQADVAAG